MRTINLPPPECPIVLLIEDELGDAELIRWQLLEHSNDAFSVHLADSLGQAKQLVLQGLKPDVVLLDLNLPDSSGPATVECCRQMIEAPIVVLTGLDDSAAMRTAIATGAEDYLTKGGEASSLRRAIRYALLRYRRDADVRLTASVFTHAREGILITTPDGTIVDVNDAFTRISQFTHDEVIGQNPNMFSSGRHSKAFYEEFWKTLIKDGYWYGEIWNRRKNGQIYAVMQTISAVKDAQGNTRQYVALFSDITSFKEHENQLEHIAHYDALTNLPNRVLLADRLYQAMTHAQRRESLLAVAYLDLDGFKAVNDMHGHDAGDQLLITVASRMKDALRECDTLARLGGDEFVAVLLDLSDVHATLPLLSRLLAAAAEPVYINGQTLHVSASLGVTFYPQGQDIDADQLLRQADQAMYHAKLGGKNRYHLFDAQQDDSMRGLHESLQAIYHALNHQEFVLYYQPKVNMRNGQVIGAEALIRWQHPVKGILPPAAFLPVIEEHALSVELGEWVIHSALKQMEQWRAQGIVLPVSVNVSAYQLQKNDFVEHLRKILAQHPTIPPSDLEIEVLETSALEDLAGASKVVAACREMGVRFSLDDFGTGYSSLTYLKRLPVSQLKIDQSFVRDMLEDPDDMAILHGVLGLATAFRRDVIAEGVETIAHGKMLLRLGCDYAQGYGIARPMPAEKIPDWLQNWQPDIDWQNAQLASRDDLPLLFASVEHRAWVLALEHYLQNHRDVPPELDAQRCHFGRWLHTAGMVRYQQHAAFESLLALHHHLHDLGNRLCESKASVKSHHIDALHHLRDEILIKIDELLAHPQQDHFVS